MSTRNRPGPRRRILASPFVVTALLAPACGGAAKPTGEGTPIPVASGGAAKPTGEETPIPVASGGAAKPTGEGTPIPVGKEPTLDAGSGGTTPKNLRPAPDRKGAWTKKRDGWAFVYGNGDEVWYGIDGQCRLQQAAHCPTGPEPIDCNPPPPQDVRCPPGLPAEAVKAK